MKRQSLILAALIAVCSLVGCKHKPAEVAIENWHFEYDGQAYDAHVPGFIHTDLMANGLIHDPYYGTNEDSVQWVAQRTWHYSTILHRHELPKGDTLWLRFDGLMGVAIVDFDHIDSRPVLVDNAFVDTYIALPSFRDSLAVYVTFFPLADSVRETVYGIPLPDRRAFTRVAPYQQGWDWGPRLTTCGIWQPVYVTNQRTTPSPAASPKGQHSAISLRQEDDSIGQSFTFYRDGEPLFCKGANWIPVHSFPIDDSANRARYRLLLCSAREAGFNMLRVWGGGIYEHDYFYDLCDSLGLMVWQDFNFSTTLYPDDEKMLRSISDEARRQVARIAAHPCVVVWCGNNEVKNGWEDWGWQDVYHWSDDQRARLQHGIDTIFGQQGILATAVRNYDPMQRPYITTSPLYGWGHPECVTHGDSHYWGVWWGEMPFETYAEKTGRFMSEFGFQSYPMMSTLRRFCPEDQLYIDSPTLRNHQKHSRGREIIDKAMQRYYGFDSRSLSLDDYAYVSQLLQAWGTGYGIMQHLAHQPHCMGTLFWQLNDCWPVASWSSIDYYGNWKALHYRAAALFADDADISAWQRYYSTYPKDRNYSAALFSATPSLDAGGTLSVHVTAESDIYDLYIETVPHVDGHFSVNFVDIAAGGNIDATFIPADPSADLSGVKIECRTLNDLYLQRKRSRK